MTQQHLYPYIPPPDEQVWCNVGLCAFHAFWWDTLHQAFWCDFHAMAIQGGALYSMCATCLEWYPSSQLVDGFCGVCRSAGSVLWSDVPEHEVHWPDDEWYGFPRDVDQVELG